MTSLLIWTPTLTLRKSPTRQAHNTALGPAQCLQSSQLPKIPH